MHQDAKGGVNTKDVEQWESSQEYIIGSKSLCWWQLINIIGNDLDQIEEVSVAQMDRFGEGCCTRAIKKSC